jgi:hypothetical protein
MSVRNVSRTIKAATAAGALTLALSGTALAMPAGPDSAAENPSGNVTTGTDVAAPDQQNPIPREPALVPQQAPTWPVNPQVLTPTTTSATTTTDAGFQWDDAGIGAGGAIAVVLAGLGATLLVRRRHVADPPLAA